MKANTHVFSLPPCFFYSMQLPLILKTSMQVNLFRIVLSFPLQVFEKYCSFSKNPTRGGGVSVNTDDFCSILFLRTNAVVLNNVWCAFENKDICNAVGKKSLSKYK